MGNRGQPKSEDIKKVNDSITKMGAARVYIDNEREASVYKYRHFVYDAPLFPYVRMSAFQNNMFTDAAIRMYAEPPLITFAKQRNQVTAIERKVLESPINKTDANLMLEDYLLERIGRMKSDKSKTPNKI